MSYVFQNEIKSMLYSFGDIRYPSTQTIQHLELITKCQIKQLISITNKVRNYRKARFITLEDVCFALRGSQNKIKRILASVAFKELRKKINDDEGGEIEIGEDEVKFDWLIERNKRITIRKDMVDAYDCHNTQFRKKKFNKKIYVIEKSFVKENMDKKMKDDNLKSVCTSENRFLNYNDMETNKDPNFVAIENKQKTHLLNETSSSNILNDLVKNDNLSPNSLNIQEQQINNTTALSIEQKIYTNNLNSSPDLIDKKGTLKKDLKDDVILYNSDYINQSVNNIEKQINNNEQLPDLQNSDDSKSVVKFDENNDAIFTKNTDLPNFNDEKSKVNVDFKIDTNFLNKKDNAGLDGSNTISYIDENIDSISIIEEIDLNQKERLRKIDEITSNMTVQEYLDYSECRQASFTYRKSKKFRDFLGITEKVKEDVIEILGFLAYEMIYDIVDEALKLKNENKFERNFSNGLFVQINEMGLTCSEIDEACRRLLRKKKFLFM
ncbi:Transcription initiation protein spt3 [Conglomerata obtusa]